VELLGSSVKCPSCGGLYQLPPPAQAKAPNAPPPPAPPQPDPAVEAAEEELEIELDGPTAAALASAPAESTPLPTVLPEVVRLEIGGVTSAGRVRDRNEDSFLLQHLANASLERHREAALVVVADGMGGHGAGEQASDLVVRSVGTTLAGVVAGILSDEPQPELAALAEQVTAALKAANRAVLQQAQKDPGCRGMGATVATVLVWEETALIGHVGDCRVYHWHEDQLTQVTQDQTLVARMVALGKLTPEEALVHPQRHEVTQAVGKGADLQPAAHQVKLLAGDWLVIASDGLQAHVPDEKLAEALLEAGPSASTLAARLVELANEGGGSDNCTVVAVRCF
jgi:protein phosphatase